MSNLETSNACTCGVSVEVSNTDCAKHRLNAIAEKMASVEIELIETRKVTNSEEALALCAAILDPMHMGASPAESQQPVDWPVIILALKQISMVAENLANRYENQQKGLPFNS